MSFDELVQKMSEDMELSIQESTNLLLSHTDNKSATYRIISKPLEVVLMDYEPTLTFYCQTSEADGKVDISRILNVNLNQDYTDSRGVSVLKQFAGIIFFNLEDAHTIYYTIDGDFYNNGTATVSNEFGRDGAQNGKLVFSVSSTYSCYESYYVADKIKLGGSTYE